LLVIPVINEEFCATIFRLFTTFKKQNKNKNKYETLKIFFVSLKLFRDIDTGIENKANKGNPNLTSG
tara:strand:- start:118 stop:318 length:201 start_codon:yes stop_codon:yes gene_type:complete